MFSIQECPISLLARISQSRLSSVILKGFLKDQVCKHQNNKMTAFRSSGFMDMLVSLWQLLTSEMWGNGCDYVENVGLCALSSDYVSMLCC